MREYVRQCGLGHILNDCYGPYERVGEILLDNIPVEEFFIKCNHLSGGNRIVSKHDFDVEKLGRYFDNLLKNNAFYSFPLQCFRGSHTLGIGGRKGTWHP